MIGLILFKYELTSWFYVFLLDLLLVMQHGVLDCSCAVHFSPSIIVLHRCFGKYYRKKLNILS